MSTAHERHQKLLEEMLRDSSSYDEIRGDGGGSDMDSTGDDMPRRRKHGGSKRGRAKSLKRDREEGHERIFSDYFAEQAIFNDSLFRRRFRMRKTLFLRVMDGVAATDYYFVQKADACGIMGASTLQKCVAAIRQLAYGAPADQMDEYCRISEDTALESMKRFCKAVLKVFGPEFLRQPTREDIMTQMEINRLRGFLGMFASIDCMHWVWKNCPYDWAGQYHDRDGNKSIILKAVADYHLRIWHVFFGIPGSNNDINVVERSHIIKSLLTHENTKVEFMVGSKKYNRAYLLADGIYPSWSCFVQTIHDPQGEKNCYFASMQEGVRKDVERAFGVLQGRFAIVKNPCRLWQPEDIKVIMLACVTLHNMIVEDELDDPELSHDVFVPSAITPSSVPSSRTFA